jgi:hypothetical protein
MTREETETREKRDESRIERGGGNDEADVHAEQRISPCGSNVT